jgi:two-component system LytT family response regulator
MVPFNLLKWRFSRTILFVTFREMMTLKSLVISDRLRVRRDFTQLIDQDLRIESLGALMDGEEAVDACLHRAPDLIFLQAESKEINAFSVVQTLHAAKLPRLIVVSSHNRYALQAFEFGALDYLVKPVSEARLKTSIDRAYREIETVKNMQIAATVRSLLNAPNLMESRKPASRFWVKTASKIEFVPPSTIRWIEACDQHVKLHCGDKCHKSRVSMVDLQRQLAGQDFVRIHRGALVNLAFIQQVLMKSRKCYSVVLMGGTRIKVSDSRKDQLLKALGEIRALEESIHPSNRRPAYNHAG